MTWRYYGISSDGTEKKIKIQSIFGIKRGYRRPIYITLYLGVSDSPRLASRIKYTHSMVLVETLSCYVMNSELWYRIFING